MKQWKVGLAFGETILYFELKGEYTQVISLAEQLAKALGGTFDYDIEEVK